MAFRGWDKLEGKIVGAPAVQVLAEPDSVIVLGRGIDDHVWSRDARGGEWARVDDDLKLESAPTVDNHLHAAGLLDIAAIADGKQPWIKSNGVIEHTAPWRLMGGKAIGEAALVARHFLFVRGLDNHLWMRPWQGEWAKLDDHWQLTSAPGVSVRDYATVALPVPPPLPPGELHAWHWKLAIAAAAVAPGRKIDGIWVKTFDSLAGEWQEGWFDRGGRCKGAPAIAGTDGFPLFVRGLDDYLWSDWGGTWRCVNAELKLTSSPGVAFDQDVTHIVVRGPDAAVYYAAWDAPAH